MKPILASPLLARAAAWPATRLDPFGDGPLAERARSGSSDLEADYERVLRRERLALAASTVGDAEFHKALWVSNPPFARLAARLDPAGPRTKRQRHLETSLYRYSSRAVSRNAPCDLWSGVAAVELGERTEVIRVAVRRTFTPELGPFRVALLGLGHTERYRRASRWAANPTLTRAADGSWRGWARSDGRVEPLEVGAHPALELTLAIAAESAGTFDDLVRSVSERGGWASTSVSRILDQMIEGGLLVGGLDLPISMPSAWATLEHAAEQLHDPERSHWSTAIEALRRIATELEARFDSLDPAGVAAMLDNAQGIVAQMQRELGVVPLAPRSALRADLGLPYRVVLGPEITRRLEAAIEIYDRYSAALGFAEPFRRALYRRIATATEGFGISDLPDWLCRRPEAPAGGWSWQTLARAEGIEAEVTPRIEAWRALLEQPSPSQAIVPERSTTRLPPLGALIISVLDQGLDIAGLIDEPLSLYSRFLDPLGADGAAIRHWIQSALGRIASDAGIQMLEYAAPSEGASNTSMRPELGLRLLTPWSASGLAGLRLKIDPALGVPLLYDARGARYAAMNLVATPYAATDPIARLCLLSSFHDAPLESMQASTIPLTDEARDGPTPEVRIEPGITVRPRRTLYAQDRLRALLDADPIARFSKWQAEAQKWGWPERVLLRRPGAPPLLVVRDSPLAVEAAFEGAGDTESIAVEEPSASVGWPAPSSELAVLFVRQGHAWKKGPDR